MSTSIFECKICNAQFDTQRKLHYHLAAKEKSNQKEYYEKYYPRFDLMTKKAIPFKNIDTYFTTLFENRENMIEYVKKIDEKKDFLRELIKIRKEHKELVYAPSTVESRSSILPSPAFVRSIGLDYNNLCESISLTTKYDYYQILDFDKGPLHIFVDTREQLPLKFNKQHTTTITKLDHGDYTCKSHYKGVFVERKSLADLSNTLSLGIERFQNELNRCASDGNYLVICVDESLENLINMPNLVFNKKKTKINGNFISHIMRYICQRYPNTQFVFHKNRECSTLFIEKLFLLKNEIAKVDLQYFVDMRLI